MVVAIDGPAGSGKSTVARAAARALGFTYLNSGAMYRAVGLLTLRRGGAASEHAERLQIELNDRVVVDGEDVSEAIRAPEVSEAASRVATNPKVRAALVDKQRELLAHGDWVVEGRDIQDSSRAHSPLRRAPGAVELDTTGLTVDEVVERIAELVRSAR
jgi:cytidylate kinase